MRSGPIKVEIQGIDEQTLEPEWTVLQRFAGRLFRRDLAGALERISPDLEEPGQILIYGSTVIQLHPLRPVEGYPYPRRPRDIDIAIINSSYATAPCESRETSVLTDALVAYFTKAVESVGGEVIDIDRSMGNPVGNIAIAKSYSAMELARRIRGKNESAAVAVATDTHVQLAISIFEPRTPLMPVVPRGQIFHEDVREVLSYKIARLLSFPGMELKDLADIYNVYATGVVDFEKEKDLIRLLSLVRIASYARVSRKNYDDYQERKTLEAKPNVWERLTGPLLGRAGAKREERISWSEISSCRVCPENIQLLKGKLFVGEAEAREILTSINAILDLVYPYGRSLPARLEYGGLPLTDGEYQFLSAGDGFFGSRVRHPHGAHLDLEALISSFPAVYAKHPGVFEQIPINYHLRRKFELNSRWVGM